jgi:predicted site-specific integrase-resolvase
MTRTAAIYARVCADDKHDLAEQVEACREHAQDHGLRVVAEFTDAGQGASGAPPAPPQLKRALELARAGGFEVLVVGDAYRLSRSLSNVLEIEDQLRGYGVDIDYVLHGRRDPLSGTLIKDFYQYLTRRADARHNGMRQYLLRGRVTCGTCGHRMRGRLIYRNSRQGRTCYLYYRCETQREPKHGRGCDVPPFRADRVDMVVWNWMTHSLQQSFPEIRENLEMLAGDFEAKRQIVEMLDVHATLAVEDGQKVVYVQSVLDGKTCKLSRAQS